MGQSSWTDVMLMIRPPPPWAIICFAATCVPKKALFRLMSSTAVVLGLGGVEHRRAGLDAGVVDHDVEPAEGLHGLADEPLEVGHLADVGVDADRLVAQGGDLALEVLGGLLVGHVVDHDLGARLGEVQRHGLADAAVAAGDDGDLAVECHDFSWGSVRAVRDGLSRSCMTRCRSPTEYTPSPGRPRMRSATTPVQPVWCVAPSPAPLSPWKYSLNTRLSFQAGSLLEALDAAEARPPAVGTDEEQRDEPCAEVVGDLVERELVPAAGRVLDLEARRRRSGGSARAR